MSQWQVNLSFLWNQILAYPFRFIESMTGFPIPDMLRNIAQGAILLLLALVILRILITNLQNMGLFRRSRKWVQLNEVNTPERIDIPKLSKEERHELKQAVAAHVKNKRYDLAGIACESKGQYHDAGKWFYRAGMIRRAAESYAQAGNAAKAADMFNEEGDLVSAARLYMDAGRYAQAGDAFRDANIPLEAADAYSMGERHKDACKAYLDYFENPRDAQEAVLETAKKCAMFLVDPDTERKAPAKLRHALNVKIRPYMGYKEE